jgi:ParB-like nuclease family protein
MDHPDLQIEAVAVAALRPYPGNPRRGSVEAIKASLRAHGQYRPIVVNRPTMQVLAGNHTLEAAKQLGWKEIAATFVDVDDEQARRIVLVDNRTNDLADYDPQGPGRPPGGAARSRGLRLRPGRSGRPARPGGLAGGGARRLDCGAGRGCDLGPLIARRAHLPAGSSRSSCCLP